jgi:hypothetical protein
MEYIYLTKDQADKVRGRHGKYSALEPIPTGDGNFILPKSVLMDSEHIETFVELEKGQLAEIEIVKIVDKEKPTTDITRETISYNVISTKAFPEKVIHKPIGG